MGIMAHARRKTHALKHFDCHGFPELATDAPVAHSLSYVLDRCQPRKQVESLEHEADTKCPDARERSVGNCGDVTPFN